MLGEPGDMLRETRDTGSETPRSEGDFWSSLQEVSHRAHVGVFPNMRVPDMDPE